jgi:hypothetical protein
LATVFKPTHNNALILVVDLWYLCMDGVVLHNLLSYDSAIEDTDNSHEDQFLNPNTLY